MTKYIPGLNFLRGEGVEEHNLFSWHNFVTLPIGMKNVMMKISALLLSVWYCLSVIGFDVHTCSSDGTSHVMTSFTSFDCETVHDSHVCADDHHHHHSDECCSCRDHHHEGASGDCACRTSGETHIHTQKCCTDDYQVIFLTGVRSGENHGHYDECSCGNCPCLDACPSDAICLYASDKKEKHILIPDSGLIVSEFQALYNIWRI